MKRVRFVIGALLLLLTVQIVSILGASSVKAELWCDDLNGCWGEAGCTEYGAVVDTCVLRCSDRTTVTCNKNGEIE